jgi:hypothetical protein
MSEKRTLSRSGSMEKAQNKIGVVYERIFVESLLMNMEQERQFAKEKKNIVSNIVCTDDIKIFESNPVQEIQGLYRGVHYWEGGFSDVIVIPSLTLDFEELCKIPGVSHYEERQLYNVILLKNPSVRLIFVTSVPLDPAIVKYYASFLPKPEDIKRLILFSVNDDSAKPLTQKILEHPRLINRLKKLITSPETTCLSCFNSTKLEHDLAKKLGINILATLPETVHWGTKSGSHKIFNECGIPSPMATDLCDSEETLSIKIVDLLSKLKIEQTKVVIKLNESFTGEGNALLETNSYISREERIKLVSNNIEETFKQELASRILKQFKNMKFQSKIENWDTFRKKIPKMGWLSEEFIDGPIKASPSGQASVDRDGNVLLLSTHEQLLGGDDRQCYLGCIFPSHQDYRLKIQEFTKKIGECLAKKGVIDHFGVDFVAVKKSENEEWEIFCIEINLRHGGTTHPMMMMKLLTGGEYNIEKGIFESKGKTKYYIASDNISSKELSNLVPEDITEIFYKHELHYNSSTECGSIFHLMGALSKYGKIGVTSIGDSLEEAQQTYDSTVRFLMEQARMIN